MIVIWGTLGFAVIAALMELAARMPLQPGRYQVRRSAESNSPVLTARLVPSHQRHAERLPAAASAPQVYRITDLPAATGARANREG